MFIFCCYTELTYQEMSILDFKHIKKGFDGNKWIKMYNFFHNEKLLHSGLLKSLICFYFKFFKRLAISLSFL